MSIDTELLAGSVVVVVDVVVVGTVVVVVDVGTVVVVVGMVVVVVAVGITVTVTEAVDVCPAPFETVSV